MTMVPDRCFAKPTLLPQINEIVWRQFLERILGFSWSSAIETGNDQLQHLLDWVSNVLTDPLAPRHRLSTLNPLRKMCIHKSFYVLRESIDALCPMSTSEISKAHQQRYTAKNASIVVLLFCQPRNVSVYGFKDPRGPKSVDCFRPDIVTLQHRQSPF